MMLLAIVFCIFLIFLFIVVMIYLWLQNAKQILAATTTNDDFEYGESRYKDARRIN